MTLANHGLFEDVHQEVGHIIVAHVNHERVRELLQADREALERLIREEPVGSEADAGVGVAPPASPEALPPPS